MIVAGGIYREECIAPFWDRLFGSGGRAATAIAGLAAGTELYGYVAEEWAEDARCSFGSMGVTPHLTPIPNKICFRYFHSLSRPEIDGHNRNVFSPLKASGPAVLRFGMLEGSAIVRGERVVYDPQNWAEALQFRANGSMADALAIVLNQSELEHSTGLAGMDAVRWLIHDTGAALVVVKRGPWGAAVYCGTRQTEIPAFQSPSLFKIGSGDVFSAVFAHMWADRHFSPEEAARHASQAVATYVASRDLQRLTPAYPLVPAPSGTAGMIYLAGPFFTLGQRWLVEEARNALLSLGASVFSPLHEVGILGDAAGIAGRDLAGLRECSAVLALIDGEDAGTLFELGYARDRGIPVVAFSEAPRPESLTMLAGSGCEITDDFGAAVYRSVWAAVR
ncbi:nucleoside 2-deoxyribosyltransferase [Bosea caraganae]|uniref:Nucleoside 2-deoxyribosyltransferase n=1 Tax=Bosea caraganae TaxID=2763117 RepID=A0A370KZ63_9HYPH|nr:PfkB family carbohydrate kinase [Bosea caraganae]RDJ20267.1 nucleoside 2-deoxyribosyltransferase [Bosea caraganae]RDJ23964.1 nucleoside 2-deoxyribosyltransferase [Bosea caraganae]